MPARARQLSTWITSLQAVHLVLVAWVVSAYGLVRLRAADLDPFASQADAAVGVGAVLWGGVLAAGAIAIGSRSNALSHLWTAYRGLLGRIWFLVASCMVLSGIGLVLLLALSATGVILIHTSEPVLLLLSDEVGNPRELGQAEPGTTSLRLAKGTRLLAFKYVASGRHGALPPIDVSTGSNSIVRIPEDKAYERLD